jgi:hypothetical protein
MVEVAKRAGSGPAPEVMSSGPDSAVETQLVPYIGVGHT